MGKCGNAASAPRDQERIAEPVDDKAPAATAAIAASITQRVWRQRNSDCYALRIAYSSRARSSIVPAVVLGALHPQRPWATALALGVWISSSAS
jgi:hypothetical protein